MDRFVDDVVAEVVGLAVPRPALVAAGQCIINFRMVAWPCRVCGDVPVAI